MEPFVYCNVCGERRSVHRSKKSFEPAKWFLNGKAAPGWFGGRVEGTHVRLDICQECAARLVTETGHKQQPGLSAG